MSKKIYIWACVVLAIIFPLFFVWGADASWSRSLKEIWDLGHFFFFALFVLVIDRYWYLKNHSVFFRCFATGIVLFCFGVGVELVQLGIEGRFFSWSDIVKDLSGGAAALLWSVSSSLPRFQSVFYRVLSIGVVVLSCLPLVHILMDETRQRRDFPLLAGFDSPFELTRWGGDAEMLLEVSPYARDNLSAKITLTTSKYSGVSLLYFPGNWSGWKGLAIALYNPGSEVELHFRVHDISHKGNLQAYGNRFNGTMMLETGLNEIVIPMDDISHGPRGRLMDLTKIRGFGFFVMEQNERRILYLDNVRLF